MVILTVALIGVSQLAGCGPEVPVEELGEIEHQLPQVPGADTPYKLPELSGGGHAHPH